MTGEANESEQTPPSDPPPLGKTLEYEKLLDCIHCGLCTSSCPTYLETGNENNSPRGRIHLMRSVVEGKIELSERVEHHLELCLDCRACETACPSGVEYGRLIEPFRVEMENRPEQKTTWFEKFILHGMFPDRKRLAWSLVPARIMQWLKLDRLMDSLGLINLLPEKLQRMHRLLPVLEATTPGLPEFLPAEGERRATVGLFLGCVADAVFRRAHWATARVLQKNGCDVFIPQSQSCCGAIHYHSGAGDKAMQLANENIAAFAGKELDAIIVNVAGCGAMMKDIGQVHTELKPDSDAEPFHNFASKTCDITEFLDSLGMIEPTGSIPAKVVYHDACHLAHAQSIRSQPRKILQSIPGIEMLEPHESEICCGAAGSYNLTQPEMADRLGKRKVSNLLNTEPDLIATGNVGCRMQLEMQLKAQGTNAADSSPD